MFMSCPTPWSPRPPSHPDESMPIEVICQASNSGQGLFSPKRGAQALSAMLAVLEALHMAVKRMETAKLKLSKTWLQMQAWWQSWKLCSRMTLTIMILALETKRKRRLRTGCSTWAMGFRH